MTDEQRRHDFFFQTELTQQQIADMLNINRKTLYFWIKEGNWKRAKYAAAHAPSVLMEQYYGQLCALNDHIADRADNPWPTKEEANTIRSLTATIKGIRNGKHTVGESVEVFQLFTDKLRRKNLPLAQQIMPLMGAHIKDLSEDGKMLNFSRLRKEQEAFDKEYETWVAQQQEEANKNNNPNPAVPATSPSPSERAGERSPAPQTPLPALNSAPQAPPSSTPPSALRSPDPALILDGASNGALPPANNPIEPTPTANLTDNNNVNLSTKKVENVDNSSPKIIPFTPTQNTTGIQGNDANKDNNDNKGNNDKEPGAGT